MFALAVLCLAFILPYSVFVQFMGTFSPTTITWNKFPDTNEKERLWNFNDNPIFRGIRANTGLGDTHSVSLRPWPPMLAIEKLF
jgi:hypothetical protein